MKVGAFIAGGAKDAQTRHRKQIKALLKDSGANIKWFVEDEGRERRDPDDRPTLQSWARHGRQDDVTMAVASLSGLFPKKWQALTWLKHQVEMYDIEIVVADDPVISKGSLHVLSAAADVQRAQIAKKSAAALEDIKMRLSSEGVYQTKSGREITRLGIHEKLAEAGVKGNKAQADRAKERDDEVWPIIQRCREQGMGYAATARHLNALGILTPAERARQNTTTNGEWYASTVRNIVIRRT